MKHFFFALLLGLVPAAQAQSASPAVWCPAGATWTYGYSLFRLTGIYTLLLINLGQPPLAQRLALQIRSDRTWLYYHKGGGREQYRM